MTKIANYLVIQFLLPRVQFTIFSLVFDFFVFSEHLSVYTIWPDTDENVFKFSTAHLTPTSDSKSFIDARRQNFTPENK